VIELTSLDVTVGDTVAFAHVLLAAALDSNSPSHRSSAYDSFSACVRSVAGGSSHTSTPDDVVSYEHEEPLQHIGP
jgi:hypothetical protein